MPTVGAAIFVHESHPKSENTDTESHLAMPKAEFELQHLAVADIPLLNDYLLTCTPNSIH